MADTKTINTNDIKNEIASKENAAPSTAITPYRKVESALKQMLPSIEQALPRCGITPERMMRVALTQLRTNPALLDADFTSLLSCIMQSAQLGLEPTLGSCYFIPYKDNKKGVTNVQFMVGYKGLLELCYRSGINSVKCGVVMENDEFDYQMGIDEKLHHKPARTNRGKPIYYYAYAKTSSNSTIFEVMSIEDIEKIRDAHSVSYKFQKEGSIWHKHFDAMAKKTVLKQLLKYVPMSISLKDSIASDGMVIKNFNDELGAVEVFEGEFVEPSI